VEAFSGAPDEEEMFARVALRREGCFMQKEKRGEKRKA